MNKKPIRPRKILRRSARHAFTLLELLLVLAILVVLGGIVAVNVVGTNEAAMQDATTTQMKMLKQNIDMYRIRINGLPDTLNSLVDGPSDASKKAKWVAPIIESVPKDAWGNDFQYEVSGNTYELRSGGIDGQLNTEDDITVKS
ncbi:MAG: type II secretion system major pseudopilin GspG [Planctomycetota bacterium]